MRNTKAFRLLLVLSACAVLTAPGCSLFGKGAKPSAPPPPTEEELRAQDVAKAKKGCEYAQSAEGILLRFSPVKDLNFFNNQAHTLYLVAYQLSDSNAFNRLVETPEGRGQLLEGKRFDVSVVSPSPAVVQPGFASELKLDRLEGTRYLGIVFGYYTQSGQHPYLLLPIPTDKVISSRGVQMECTASRLMAEIHLGRSDIVTNEPKR